MCTGGTTGRERGVTGRLKSGSSRETVMPHLLVILVSDDAKILPHLRLVAIVSHPLNSPGPTDPQQALLSRTMIRSGEARSCAARSHAARTRHTYPDY